jgi:hypothetical protein
MKAQFSSSPALPTTRPAPRLPSPASLAEPSAPSAAVSKSRAALRPKLESSAQATAGGGGLAVRDLSHKPQPAWGADPFSTRLQLEQHRLFAKAEARSPAAALQMYERVARA